MTTKYPPYTLLPLNLVTYPLSRQYILRETHVRQMIKLDTDARLSWHYLRYPKWMLRTSVNHIA